MQTEKIEIPRSVICEICGTDWTDNPKTGGYLHGNLTIGPCCDTETFEKISACENHETKRCPDYLSYSDFVIGQLEATIPVDVKSFDSIETLFESISSSKPNFERIISKQIDEMLGNIENLSPKAILGASMAKRVLPAFEEIRWDMEQVEGSVPADIWQASIATITFMLTRLVKAYSLPEHRVEALRDLTMDCHKGALSYLLSQNADRSSGDDTAA